MHIYIFKYEVISPIQFLLLQLLDKYIVNYENLSTRTINN
jgi:hypothetical protein